MGCISSSPSADTLRVGKSDESEALPCNGPALTRTESVEMAEVLNCMACGMGSADFPVPWTSQATSVVFKIEFRRRW